MSGAREVRSARSARVVAVTLIWIWRTLAGLLIACPVVFAIASTGLVGGPGRDGVLFQPGALVLLEVVRVGAAALGPALEVSLLLSGVCAVFGLVPLGAAIDLLWTRRADALGERLVRGCRLFPRFLALSLIVLLAQAALLLAASLLGGGLTAALRHRDERLLGFATLALYALALLGCAALGALLDLARGVAVRQDLAARPALVEALASLRRSPGALLLACYPSVTGSWCAWLGAAWLLTKIDLASPSTRTIALAFVVHQVVILLSAGLRVRWLNGALEHAASAPSARD